MEINVTINCNSAEEAGQVMQALAGIRAPYSCGSDMGTVVLKNPAAPPMQSPANTTAVPAPVLAPPSIAAAPIAPVIPAAPPVVPTATPSYTLEMIATAGSSLIDAGKLDALVALLNKYGVASLTNLAPEHYGAVAMELRALGARL